MKLATASLLSLLASLSACTAVTASPPSPARPAAHALRARIQVAPVEWADPGDASPQSVDVARKAVRVAFEQMLASSGGFLVEVGEPRAGSTQSDLVLRCTVTRWDPDATEHAVERNGSDGSLFSGEARSGAATIAVQVVDPRTGLCLYADELEVEAWSCGLELNLPGGGGRGAARGSLHDAVRTAVAQTVTDLLDRLPAEHFRHGGSVPAPVRS